MWPWVSGLWVLGVSPLICEMEMTVTPVSQARQEASYGARAWLACSWCQGLEANLQSHTGTSLRVRGQPGAERRGEGRGTPVLLTGHRLPCLWALAHTVPHACKSLLLAFPDCPNVTCLVKALPPPQAAPLLPGTPAAGPSHGLIATTTWTVGTAVPIL